MNKNLKRKIQALSKAGVSAKLQLSDTPFRKHSIQLVYLSAIDKLKGSYIGGCLFFCTSLLLLFLLFLFLLHVLLLILFKAYSC